MTTDSAQRAGAAIVGGGFVAAVHARALRVSGVRLVGVLAGSTASTQRAAAALGAERAYPSLDALVDDDEVAIVHICAPNHVHHQAAAAALAAGRHVVCEKPLDTSLGGALALMSQADEGPLVAAVPFVYRFYPMVREARARHAAGELGDTVLIHGGYLQDWLLDGNDTNWRVDPLLGGPSRAFADIGSHWTDLAEFITADAIVAVNAQTRVARPSRPTPRPQAATFSPGAASGSGAAAPPARPAVTEDVAVVQLRFASGAIGSLTVSQVAAGHGNDLWLEVDGTGESIAFAQERPDELVIGSQTGRTVLLSGSRGSGPAAARYTHLPAGHPHGYQDCFDAFVADVLDAVAGGDPDGLPTFAAGARAAAVTEAVLASAASDRWVDVASGPTHPGERAATSLSNGHGGAR